jgi:ankyrin repeat protein
MLSRAAFGIILAIVLAASATAGDIHDAIERGDTATVKSLLAGQADALNARDQNGLTPLNLAAYKGNVELVKYLLARGADRQIGDNEGSLPIHNAAAAGHTAVVELLVAEGSDINAQDNNQETALLFALARRQFETAAWLLDHGADPKISNRQGITPLHYAVSTQQGNLCRRLITLGADVNARTLEGNTPLVAAALSGNIEITRLLLDTGADIEARDGWERTPLLLVARERGDAEMAAFLLDRGADINAEDKYKDTPLSLAAWRGFRALTDLLMDRGAALPATQQLRDGVASYCAQRGLVRLLRSMIDAGANIMRRSGSGIGFLHAAAIGGSSEACELLLANGLPVNEQDAYGRTPLHYAAERGRTQACGLLIARGATVDVKSMAGYTPFNLAQEFGHDSTANLLGAHGASTAPPAFPRLQGSYFGQTPPGDRPALFAPDIVASSRFKHGNVTFSPDGREAYWASEYTFNDSGYSVGGILTSKVEGDTWTLPKLAEYSTVGNGDDVPFFSPDGNRLYFLSRRTEQPGGRRGAERIWYLDRTATGWSQPHLIAGGPNSHGLHWQFSVAANGNIYFAFDDPRGLGGGDIWVSKYSNGSWQPGESLGAEVNSPGVEMCPYIAPDESYIIVCLDQRFDGQGELDFHISFRTPEGGWTKPVNMGPSVNSPSNDICPFVSVDGKYLFFNSSRDDALDIWWVDAGIIQTLKKEALK